MDQKPKTGGVLEGREEKEIISRRVVKPKTNYLNTAKAILLGLDSNKYLLGQTKHNSYSFEACGTSSTVHT